VKNSFFARTLWRIAVIGPALVFAPSANAVHNHNTLTFADPTISARYKDLETNRVKAAAAVYNNDFFANQFLSKAVPPRCISYDSNTIRAVRSSSVLHATYDATLNVELVYLESIEPQLDAQTRSAVRVVENQINDERADTERDAARQLMTLIRYCQ